MATPAENWFEIERRVILFKPTTTMPDNTLLGYDGDPNNADPNNSDGEYLLYNSPIGTQYIQSNGTEWRKKSLPNTWVLFADGTGTGTTPVLDRKTLTITQTDIDNGYIEVDYTINTNEHCLVNLNGMVLFYGDDYTINGNRIEFTSEQISLLTVGDRIQITYKYTP